VSEEKANERVESSYSSRKLSDLRVFMKRINSVQIRGKRRGFLPFDTNPFDRVFVSIVLLVAIHLLWMRFLEEYITLTVATILLVSFCWSQYICCGCVSWRNISHSRSPPF